MIQKYKGGDGSAFVSVRPGESRKQWRHMCDLMRWNGVSEEEIVEFMGPPPCRDVAMIARVHPDIKARHEGSLQEKYDNFKITLSILMTRRDISGQWWRIDLPERDVFRVFIQLMEGHVYGTSVQFDDWMEKVKPLVVERGGQIVEQVRGTIDSARQTMH